MKKKIIEISFILMGIILIAYPVISVCIASFNQTIAISNYQEVVNSLSQDEKENELQKAREYNSGMEGIVSVDISMSSSQDDSVSYLNVLNIGEAMAYISIPKINVYLPIYHGLSENVLQSGVGHLETTSLPVGGLGTHSVLAGHTGLVRTKIFDDINKLEEKDKFYIDVLGETLAYEVDKIDVVLPEDTDCITVEPDKDYITLITCTPYMINSHRLLVRGSRIELEDIENKEKNELKTNIERISSKRKTNIVISIISFIIITIAFMIYIFKGKKKETKKGG